MQFNTTQLTEHPKITMQGEQNKWQRRERTGEQWVSALYVEGHVHAGRKLKCALQRECTGSKHSFMCILGKARRDALQPCVCVDMFSFPNLRCVPCAIWWQVLSSVTGSPKSFVWVSMEFAERWTGSNEIKSIWKHELCVLHSPWVRVKGERRALGNWIGFHTEEPGFSVTQAGKQERMGHVSVSSTDRRQMVTDCGISVSGFSNSSSMQRGK